MFIFVRYNNKNNNNNNDKLLVPVSRYHSIGLDVKEKQKSNPGRQSYG